MSAFDYLPQNYKIAILLGARVEVFHNDKWHPYYQMIGLTRNSQFRVVQGDENILESVENLTSDFFVSVIFKDYEYMMPKNALKEHAITIMQFGFGVYVQVQNGQLVELSVEEGKKYLEDHQTHPYYSQMKESFKN